MITFEQLDEDDGVRIVDPIERRQFDLRTPDAVTPIETEPDGFRFPVDGAVAVETESLSASVVSGFVRDETNDRVATVEPGVQTELPAGAYSVELNASVKVYLQVPGPVVADAGPDCLSVTFGGARTVRIGARSYHERPAATITVPDDPHGLLDALPALASSLKTTSCERSFPTLRGHPPLLSVGDRLSIPDCLEPPDTGITLELPPEYRSLLVAAPLSYYLGADVKPASEPRLVTDQGFERTLDGPDGFERTVQRVLEQLFLLDCVTRTEGLYRVDLAERNTLESAIDLDFAALYDAPPERRLAAYLSVPYARVAPQVPTWSLTAHLPATADSAAILPYVLDDLGVVRTATARRLSPSDVRSQVLDQYADVARSGGATESGGSSNDSGVFVEPDSTGSMEEAWFGEGLPLGATKSTLSAFRNRLADGPREGPTDVVVVCNDPEMFEERDAVRQTYGSRTDFPFEVSIYERLSTSELADLLATERDFLHYVGHVDDDGVECSDGYLDAADLSDVGVRAFLLNACRSYRQGRSLVDAGSIGGVVTLDDVADEGALTIGRTIARLLDLGFPLGAALTIARAESVVGGHYIVVGDGSVDVAQDETGIPILCDATAADGASANEAWEESRGQPERGTYDVTVRAYLPREGGMGSLAHPFLGDADRHFLAPGELGAFRVEAADLRAALEREWCPLRVDGNLLLPGDDWHDSLPRPPGVHR